MIPLEQVIADAREEAKILERNGHLAQARSLERFADQVAEAAEPFTRWLSEDKAHTKSGRSVRWLRAQFDAWEAQQLARWRHSAREYLDVAVPQRVHLSTVRAEARAQARRAS